MIEMYNRDCMDLMAEYEDNHFDLAIVDPPYGIKRDVQNKTVCKNPKHNRKQLMNGSWDAFIPDHTYFAEVKRVSADQIIWGANYFVEHLSNPSKGWIVWDKCQYGLTMSDVELAYSSLNNPTRLYRKNRSVLIQQNTFHPTEKPIHLYKWLLHNYAKEGDKILDTHGGSGSIAIACHDMGFDLTWTELDKDYYDAAVKRFNQHKAQLTLPL